uniref:Putative single-stranded DNA-binding protein n=1 Tax=viral metagenome TaxID=1070528 RepID=A0A6M3M6L6_9ZZZZ
MAKMYGLMRLGRDAEVKTLQSGKQVANLSLAYHYGQKEGDAYPTQWIDAAFWGERAEKLAPYLVKGSLHCFTLGDVHIEEYEKDGYAAFKLAARVDDVELGPKRDSGGSDAPPQRRPAPAPAPRQAQAPAPRSASGFDDMDDESIPF